MHSKGINQRDRSSRMHHRKQKNGPTGTAAIGKSIGRKESGIEAMARLRYLNKKPLCLQYNFAVSTYGRKINPNGIKRREQSFIIVILCGIYRFFQWAAKNLQQATVDFLAKPAHELFPNEISSQCCHPGFSRSEVSLKRRPARRLIVRRNDLTKMLSNIDSKCY